MWRRGSTDAGKNNRFLRRVFHFARRVQRESGEKTKTKRHQSLIKLFTEKPFFCARLELGFFGEFPAMRLSHICIRVHPILFRWRPMRRRFKFCCRRFANAAGAYALENELFSERLSSNAFRRLFPDASIRFCDTRSKIVHSFWTCALLVATAYVASGDERATYARRLAPSTHVAVDAIVFIFDG